MDDGRGIGVRGRIRLTRLVAVGVAVVALARPVGGATALRFEFEWRSVATLSRWDGRDVVTTHGELQGRGPLLYEPQADGTIRLRFTSPAGAGEGLIVDGVPQALSFPTALAVGEPPAPPHLIGGTVRFTGDPLRPSALEIAYAEGFICRSAPSACGGVTAWRRELTGRARR